MRTHGEDSTLFNALVLNMLEADLEGPSDELEFIINSLILGKVHPYDMGLIMQGVISVAALVKLIASSTDENPIEALMTCITGDE